MAEQVAPASQPNLKQPDASAETISADEYMAQYAHDFYEWVKGELIKISPVSEKHDALTRYFTLLLEAYFSLNPIGKLRQEPFVMRLETVLEWMWGMSHKVMNPAINSSF